MLKLILDTNLFRRKELNHLEDYKFSNLFEKLYKLISNQDIQDVNICIDEMALLEYIEQIGNWYENDIVKRYDKIFDAVHDRYPMQKMYFDSRNDFIETYKYEILNNLKSRGISIIQTVPELQEGGVSIVKVIEKTIRDIPPFDKKHNKDLKDAFISETINTSAENDKDNLYIFITLNKDDFKDNVIEIANYKIEFIYPKDELFQIFDIIKKYGSSVSDLMYYKELLKKERFDSDIKHFVENHILNEEYYDSVPVVKKDGDFYYKEYEILDDNMMKLYFYLITDEGGI